MHNRKAAFKNGQSFCIHKYWQGENGLVISNENIILEGEKVKLTPMEMEHADGLWQAAMPDIIWSYMATKIRTKEEMKGAIKTAISERDKGTQYPFAVFDKERSQIIGSTRYIDISEDNKSLEIGWTWYHPDVWRTQVNTECKLLLLEHAFETLKINRVQWKTDIRNIRSQTAIARLGAIKEGVLRKDRILKDGYVRDTVVYSMLKEEWPTAKEKLHSKMNNL